MNFAKGDRIELVHTSDPHTRLEPGDLGTVRRYDPLLQHLYIDWDNGSRLALLLDAGDCACHAPAKAPVARVRFISSGSMTPESQ
ncbi:DUF4314 domain-containing protein [Streptomyces sp. NPDC006990]|uniref:DUF4314 domain-containing protein n=1 Tax=Streptomyces sp. NPDC006990 TaxID=3154481 RepID=UPI0034514F3B